MPRIEPQAFTLLVVDDDEMNRDLLSRRLEKRGYSLRVAAHGLRALEVVEAAAPDLILLDVMMPVMSGLEVLARLRTQYRPDELPIVMASARNDTRDVVEALAMGANDYVTKPIDFPLLLARIEMHLVHKVAVEDLRASEARFRLLAELSTDLVSLHAPDGMFRFASPACRELLGYEPGELEGHVRLQDLLHEEDRATMPVQRGDLPDVHTLVARLRRKDGRLVWVEVNSRTLRGSRTRQVTDIQCTTRDISFYVDAWAQEATATPLPAPLAEPPLVPRAARSALPSFGTPSASDLPPNRTPAAVPSRGVKGPLPRRAPARPRSQDLEGPAYVGADADRAAPFALEALAEEEAPPVKPRRPSQG